MKQTRKKLTLEKKQNYLNPCEKATPNKPEILPSFVAKKTKDIFTWDQEEFLNMNVNFVLEQPRLLKEEIIIDIEADIQLENNEWNETIRTCYIIQISFPYAITRASGN